METKSVTIINANGDNLNMIKAIKNWLEISLMEARDVVDQMPCIVTGIPKEIAENLVKDITIFGGTAFIDHPKLRKFIYCTTHKHIQ